MPSMLPTRTSHTCKNSAPYSPYTRTVHHIVHIKDNWEKRLDLDNLETICLECHNKEHPEKGAKNKKQTLKLYKQRHRNDICKFKSNNDDLMLF